MENIVPASSYWNIINWISLPPFPSPTQAAGLIPWICTSWAAAFTVWEAGWCQLGFIAQMCGDKCGFLTFCQLTPAQPAVSAAVAPGGVWNQFSTLPCYYSGFTTVTISSCPIFSTFCHQLLFSCTSITFLLSVCSNQVTFILLRWERINWEEYENEDSTMFLIRI